MKYDKPEMVELTSAIDAIQSDKSVIDGEGGKDASPAYEDWE